MKTDHDLKLFTDAVIASARAEADEIMKAVDARRGKAIAAAEDTILHESFRYIQTEVAAIRARAGERISRKDLECKQAFFTRREEIVREIMDEVRRRLDTFIKSERYGERLTEIAREIAAMVGTEDVTVFIRKEDEVFRERLAACFGGKVTFEASDVRIGGMMAIPAGSNKCYDQTFDSNIGDLRNRFLETVGLGM